MPVHKNIGSKKYLYIFSVTNEVDKRFKYEEKYYTINNSEINTEVLNNIEPIFDTIAFSTIEKNKNFNFLISVPMQS